MSRRGYAAWLSVRLRPYGKHLLLGLSTAIVAGLVGTVDPLLMRHWLDVTLPERRLLDSLVTVSLIALCFVGRSGLAGLAGLVAFRVTQFLAQDLRVELLAHMTSLSADWHERTLLGEKLSRIEQDVDQIAQFGADFMNTALRAGIFFLVNLAIMLTLNWRMTLTMLPLLPLFLWVRVRFRSIIQFRADRAQTEVGRASSNVTEHLAAVPQIQILCAEEARMSHTVRAWIELLGAQWAQRRTEIAFSVTITSVLALAILFVLGLGTHEYLVGLLSLGSLVAFYAYVTRIFEPVSTAMELYSRSQRMLASARRVRGVLETKSSVPDTGLLEIVPSPLLLGLSCDSVSFAYIAEHRVLHDLTVQIGSRDRVALIGKSGSGKSTLARLLARVVDPNSGLVMLEGRSANEYTLRTVRRTICYVPQHPILFSGTIRENLLYANRGASAADIDSAIEAAQLLPVLGRLPHGLDTRLGPDASGLSGGERQRLAVARALLRQSALLILDESTSALDLPTEQAVLQSIATLRKDLALVVVSHRLRSLAWADRIILLSSGRVVAQGTHSNLYNECALYRDLYEKDEVIDERRSHPQASTTRQNRLSLPA